MLLAPAGAGGGAGGGGGLGGPTGLPRWLWLCIAATVITLQVLIVNRDRAILERNCATAPAGAPSSSFAGQHSSMVVHDYAAAAAAAAAAGGQQVAGITSEAALREWAASHGLVFNAPAVEEEVGTTAGEPPESVLVVTAEQPEPCASADAQWLHARAMRNRLAYTQEHPGYRLLWNAEQVDPKYPVMWNKVALLNLLLNKPAARANASWLLWMDSDAFFTDMSFEFPIADYDAAGANLVLWGEPSKVDFNKTATPTYFGLNAGIMLLRVCDWTRDLFSRLMEAGAHPEAATREQEAVIGGFCDRQYDCVVSDQSTLVYLLYTEPDRWRNFTVFEKRFALNGHWKEYQGRLEQGTKELRGGPVWRLTTVPFIMHFSGCQLCSGRTDPHYADAEDWGDLARMGLRHNNLSTTAVVEGIAEGTAFAPSPDAGAGGGRGAAAEAPPPPPPAAAGGGSGFPSESPTRRTEEEEHLAASSAQQQPAQAAPAEGGAQG